MRPPLVHLIALLLLVSPVWADEALNLVEQRLRVQTELQQLRQAGEEEQAQLETDVAELQAEVEAIRQELVAQEQALADSRDDLQRLQAERETAAQEADTSLLRARETVGLAAESLQRTPSFHAEAVRPTITGIQKRLDTEDPAVQSAAIADLCRFLGEELATSREMRLEAVPVRVGERQWPAYRLRVGLSEAFFLTESGELAGWADPAADDGWRLLDEGPAFTAITELISMMRGQATAELAPLPLRPLEATP